MSFLETWSQEAPGGQETEVEAAGPQRGDTEPILTEQGPPHPPPHGPAASKTSQALISGIYQHSIYEQQK